MDNDKLFIANLHYSTTEDELKELFSPYSPVSVHVPYDKKTASNKDFGFVIFDSREQLIDAVNHLNGVEFKGHKLDLREVPPSTFRDNTNCFEISEKESDSTPFSIFFQIQIIWHEFFLYENRQNFVEKEMYQKINEQKERINNEATQQKDSIQSQFAQIRNEYQKTIEILKPYL